MRVNRRSRRLLRVQTVVFVVLFLGIVGLLAWLGEQYRYQSDWTANARHTLAPASVAVLEQMPASLTVRAFTADPVMKRQIGDLISRYQLK